MIIARIPSERPRHIDIQHFAIQDWKDAGDIIMQFIHGLINPSDDLTDVVQRDLFVMKQFSLIEIISTAVLLVIVVVDLLESSMLLTQLHFKLPPGAHLLLMEYQLCQLHFQHTPVLQRCGSMFGFRSSDSVLDVD